MTETEQRVVDGSVWEEFCDAPKEAGKVIQSDKAPKDPFNQAEGYRSHLRHGSAPLGHLGPAQSAGSGAGESRLTAMEDTVPGSLAR